MKWIIVLLLIVFVSSASGATALQYVFEVTTDLDAEGVAENWVVVPDTGVSWLMFVSDPTVRKVLLRKPAPLIISTSTTIGLIVDTPPDQAPPNAGAWHKAIIDLTSVGLALPPNSSYRLRGWIRYKHTDVDFSEAAAFILEKRQAGRGSVVSEQ